jgi:uncharacterized protein (TIGR02453 family)
MAGLSKETFQFLKDLKKNNDRDWFLKNKKRYEAAYADWQRFVGELITGIAKFDKNVAAAKFQPKNCIFRIYRDVRFSKDKSPYKTHLAARFMTKKGKWQVPGYYIHVAPGDSFMGGGVYMVEPVQLQALREEISLNGSKFKKIVEDKNFKKHFKLGGDKLVNVPKGFAKDDPMAEYLKHKDVLMSHKVDEKDALSPKFSAYCIDTFKAMQPLNLFMEKPLANP